MCTVTFLPLGDNNFILTSNRDETPLRKTIAPQKYIEDNVEITYPKDAIAGGTWIGNSSKNRVVCLLNGGFIKHKKILPYRMSRGIIVKNILKANDAVQYILEFDFDNIEPFTLVLVDWNGELETHELVWDGMTKHFTKLPQKPRIWSSSPLYNLEMKKQRENWFQSWLQSYKKYTKESILNFHKNENLGTPDISLKMKRRFVETVSITLVEKKENAIEMEYFSFF